MRVAYTKNNEFKIFGLTIFELKTKYYERSNDKDDEDDEMYIELNKRILEEKWNNYY